MACALQEKLGRVLLRIRPADWPRCSRCEMPVEAFWADVDAETVILVAQCHGRVQTAEIPDELWDSWSPADFTLGPAFEPEPQEELTDDRQPS